MRMIFFIMCTFFQIIYVCGIIMSLLVLENLTRLLHSFSNSKPFYLYVSKLLCSRNHLAVRQFHGRRHRFSLHSIHP